MLCSRWALTNGLSNSKRWQSKSIALGFKIIGREANANSDIYSVAPVHRAGQMKGKPQNVPDRPPPPGYLCYRCGLKGHWIHVCPTNGDPEYENRPRIKRTTGIPRSFLKTVEKPIAIANDGTVDDTKHPSGIMVNADGEFVVAEPDQASWDQYQAKTKVPAATMEAAVRSSKELQEKGLECSIDKRLFVDPTKTPCCHTTFCHDCLTNALLENDLRCPGCSTDNVLIDDLMPDEETTAKIRIYEEEKAADKLRNEKLKSSVKREPMSIPKPADSPSKDSASSPSVPSQYQKVKSPSKKRAAESELDNNRTPPGPLEKETTQTEADGTRSKFRTQNAAASSMPFPFSGTTNMMLPGMNTMSMPNMNNFMGWPMSTGPQIALNPAMNNIMNTNNPFMNTDFSNRWNMGFAQQNMNMGMNGLGFQSGTMPDSGYNQPNMLMGNNHMNNNTGKGMNGGGGRMNNQGQGNFANQQRTSFGATTNNEEDSAYFRKPVNPHRHQARRNFNRPTDYREI